MLVYKASFLMKEESSNNKNNTESQDEEDPVRIMPVIREEVEVDRRRVKKASILIEKTINNEEVTVDIPLTEDHYDIEYIPVNQYVDKRPEIRQEGEATVIPVIKEVMVKKLLLTEEIRITRKVKELNKTEKINLRKEEVKITRKENHQRY